MLNKHKGAITNIPVITYFDALRDSLAYKEALERMCNRGLILKRSEFEQKAIIDSLRCITSYVSMLLRKIVLNGANDTFFIDTHQTSIVCMITVEGIRVTPVSKAVAKQCISRFIDNNQKGNIK